MNQKYFQTLFLTVVSLLLLCQPVTARILFKPMLDASMSLNTARYDVEYATNRTDADGNSINTTDESTSNNFYIYAAPNFAFTEIPNLWITPSVEFEYFGANNILNIEDETFIFDKTAKTYVLLGGNYRFDRTWQIKLKGFGRLELNKSANDETLENGYYSYHDWGGWTEGRAIYQIMGLPMRSKLGIKYYGRRYPNATNADLVKAYKDAGFSTTNIPEDLHDKDINVFETWLRQEVTWGRLPVLSNLEIHVKNVNYTEQRVIKLYDTFSSDIREDNYLDGYLEIPFLINKYHQIEVDYGARLRVSNQNYQSFSEDLFIENYYTYIQQRISFLYNFGFAFKLGGYSPKGSISYSYQHKKYPSRPSKQMADAQDTDGTYMFDKPHWEEVHDFGITFRQTLFAKWFNLFLSFHTITQNSNTTVEDTSSYNFKYNTFTLGTAVQF